MASVIEKIRNKLEQHAEQKNKESEKHYFKEAVKLLGVKTATVEKIGKEVFATEVKTKSKPEIFSLCEKLWATGYIEEAFIACNWSHTCKKEFQPDDILLFESWITKYVTNWATCDTFCNYTVGELVSKFPYTISNLKLWAKSPNRWLRRAAAVSLIIPARHGEFLDSICDIALILLTDKDDLVQKGYGWLLKAASQAHQAEVFDFVMKHKAEMPRTALRYAIEKMPLELRKMAMIR
jgi:3-methyladenine DNA glycosylase AlkD